MEALDAAAADTTALPIPRRCPPDDQKALSYGCRGAGRVECVAIVPESKSEIERTGGTIKAMKFWWRLAGAVVIAFLALLAVARISSGTYVSADEQKQSKFLRTYDPLPFLGSFRVGCSVLGTLVGASGAAGYTRFGGGSTNVRFTRTIQPDLCNTNHPSSILTGLQQKLVSALDSAGCEVSSDWLSLDQGIRIYYRCGTRTSGLVTVNPPKSRNNGRPMLKLQIDEHWSV